MKRNAMFISFVLLLTLISFSFLLAETQTVKLLTNAHCKGCKSKIEKALKKVDGVKSANLDLASKIVEVSFDADKIKIEQLIQAIDKAGYSSVVYKENENITLPEHKDKDCKEAKQENSNGTKSSKKQKTN
ncbi:MAG: heavy-metal-associated domain-containing protein [Candidatus Kapaibacteriales bacterium]